MGSSRRREWPAGMSVSHNGFPCLWGKRRRECALMVYKFKFPRVLSALIIEKPQVYHLVRLLPERPRSISEGSRAQCAVPRDVRFAVFPPKNFVLISLLCIKVDSA